MAVPQPLMAGLPDPEPMGAACGDKYRHLITNAAGLKGGDPCNYYCNASDHEMWNASAMAMKVHKVDVAWSIYVEAAIKAGIPIDPGLEKQKAAFNSAVLDLPEPETWTTPETNTGRIAKAVAAMELGACVLEQLDAATTSVGAKPAPVPGSTPPTPSGTVFGLPWWVIALAVGGAVYAADRR